MYSANTSPPTTLPATYYHDHFIELLDTLESRCQAILPLAAQQVIQAFKALPFAQQCLLVRVLNRRRGPLLKTSLYYSEIAAPADQLQALLAAGWLRLPNPAECFATIAQLTKLQLQTLVAETDSLTAAAPKKSATKAIWVAFVTDHFQQLAQLTFWQDFVVLADSTQFERLLFVYFGKLPSLKPQHSRASMTQFSLRDLGVAATHKQAVQSARQHFAHPDEAEACFQLALITRELKHEQPDQAVLEQLTDQWAQWSATTTAEYALRFAQVAYQHSRCSYYLGLRWRQLNAPALALRCWRVSDDPRAKEQFIRLAYAQGEKALVKSKLEDWLTQRELLDDSLRIFSEDFYARKYEGKRTGIHTDLLRAGLTPIDLDEAFLKQPEQGMIQYLRGRGEQAQHTENQLWRQLFGLVFWPELYHAAGLASEFDRLPPVLIANRFYQDYQVAIEVRLDELASPAHYRQHLLTMSTRYYGTPNGIFRWHQQLLEPLFVLIDRLSVEQLAGILRDMARDYLGANDGFPDLMAWTADQVRFIEVKAPGDQLRRNQVAAIELLRRHHVQVDVQPTLWRYNPAQVYVVVDIETTGGTSDRHRITEIAMAKIQQGKVTDRWHSLIHPQRRIPAHITKLTGISDEMVARAPTFVEVADSIREFLTDAIFVAHNVRFDYGFIQREFARIEQGFQAPQLCTVRLARRYLPGLSSYKLSALAAEFSLPLSQHHRAQSDVEATVALFQLINQQRDQSE